MHDLQSIVHVFFATARRLGSKTALREPAGDGWTALGWDEYAARVRLAARGLIHLGLEPGRSVALVGSNRASWLISDLAVMAAGGVPVPLYTNCTGEQAAYIISSSGARILIADSAEQIGKVRAAGVELDQVVQIAGDPAPEAMSFAQLCDLGAEVANEELEQRLSKLTPDTLATLIYTSGTTGPPKGVMLSHRNFLFTSKVMVELIETGDDEVLISYLPLSHIAEQMVSLPVALTCGATLWLCHALEDMPATLRAARPTLFLGVPRVWEKMQAKIKAAAAGSSGLKRRIGAWARGVGLAAAAGLESGGKKPRGYGLARRLVFTKVRAALGFDRLRLCCSGAAPLGRDTQDFFCSLGLPIFEIYGLSETTGVVSVNHPRGFRRGTVGRVLPGTEIRIAEDGEIMVRGDSVFMGYYGDPAATAEVLIDGWLATGDVGEVDDDGYLRITDRKKELIVTAGGKNIAPTPLEASLSAIEGVDQAAVVGDRRKYLVALLTVDTEVAPTVLRHLGGSADGGAEIAGDERFRDHVWNAVEAINEGLARYETIKKVHILGESFSIEGGELTPTMKLKRRVVDSKYAALIESLFEGDA